MELEDDVQIETETEIDEAEEHLTEEESTIVTTEDDFPRVCTYENCGRSFRRREPFLKHMKLHQMKETSEKLKKKKANRKSKKKRSLRRGGVYECDFCKTTYTYRKSFLKHVASHQDPPPENQCQECAEIFSSGEELDHHLVEKHRRKKEKKKPEYKEIKCHTCNIEFATLDLLSSHNIDNHGIVGDPCHICGKYVKKSSMRNHVMRVHHADQIRKYTCQICGKVYKTRTDLETHSTKHTGSKLYTCPVCGKSYRFWGGIDNCLRRHSGDMRYSCQHCGKKFNDKFRLRLHTRIHEGVRPFKCPSCRYDCSRRDNLITHMKRTHNNTLEEVRRLLQVPTTSEAA